MMYQLQIPVNSKGMKYICLFKENKIDFCSILFLLFCFEGKLILHMEYRLEPRVYAMPAIMVLSNRHVVAVVL